MIRKAKAIWRGTGRDGGGTVSTGSGVLTGAPYSFLTRFENEKGTNPEELIAAAHAGCFAMTTAFILQDADRDRGRGRSQHRAGGRGVSHQSLGSDAACSSPEPGPSCVCSNGQWRREELPGFQGP
jgi:organic hydroperoxide reductase OsmC/OhrA